MTDSDNTIGWRKLREFADVDLTKSFVLSWHAGAGTVSIDVDLYLEADHPFYEKPRPAERVCIRPAIIEFRCCESAALNGKRSAGSLAEFVASLDVGIIQDLRRINEGPYEIHGGFGVVKVDSERPVLRLRSP